MTLPLLAAWAWIPIVLVAALSQTVRNAAQRTLTNTVGALPATLVRFLYGLPFALAWLLCAQALVAVPGAPPQFTPVYFAWLTAGALAQISATFFLLSAMKERNFIVAVTFSKTELLQVALFATLFLREVPTWVTSTAVLLATLGVVALSLPAKGVPTAGGAWLSRTALFGLASGASFAIANVAYRGAALTMADTSAWIVGAWGVLLAQAIQSVALGGYLALKDPGSLGAIARAWRLSLVAGSCGALASIGWFTAFALRPAADVRTLGLAEVLFSYLVSRRIFKESMTLLEISGMVLVTAGVVLVCW
jgi:drug/metabolite transporter (DMT)-like permease